MRLELGLLGGFSARAGDAHISLPTRKAQALLCYLALSPGREHEREKLAGIFWGETAREHAHASLRQTLFCIRRASPPAVRGALVVTGRTIALDDERVRIDAVLFERAVVENTLASLEEAAALYRGHLLEGFGIDELPFDEWMTLERSRFAELSTVALARLAEGQVEQGAMDRAIRTRLQLQRLEPLAEDNHRALMQLYALQGRRSAALALYQQCAAILDKELGVEPELLTKQLYDKLVASGAGPACESPKPARRSDARPAELPDAPRPRVAVPAAQSLIGREEELRELRTALDESWTTGGRVAVLVGEAGVGKTRLLERLADEVRARGGLVVRGRCFESEHVLPFAPWVDALGRTPLSEGSLRERLPAAFRSALSRLVPTGAEAPPNGAPTRENARRIFEAVTALLSFAAEKRPLAVLLDDLHWADPMSLRLLSYVGRHLASAPGIFVATSIRETERNAFLATALAELSREASSVTVPIRPLPYSETMTLVESLAARDGVVPGPLRERIWTLSEGNPFVVVEAVRALSVGSLHEPAQELAVPERVREVIAGHVTRTGLLAQQLVAIAAVIGREFAFPVLRAASGRDDVETSTAVEELVHAGIFRCDGELFSFAHDRIRKVVYDGMVPPRRAALHGLVARALSSLHAGAIDEASGQLAFHYAKADEPKPAISHLLRFAEKALRSFGVNEALAALDEAAALTKRLPQTERAEREVEIAVRQANCLYYLGRLGEIVPCLERHRQTLEGLGRPDLAAQVAFWFGLTHSLLGNATLAKACAERALSEAARAGDTRTARRAHTLLAWEAAFRGAFWQGVAHGLEATRDAAGPDVEREYVALGFMTAAMNYMHLGHHRVAIEALEQASALARAAGTPHIESMSVATIGLAHAQGDEPSRALEDCQRAVSLAADPLGKIGVLTTFAHTLIRTGRPEDALAMLPELIDTAERFGMHRNLGGVLAALAEAHMMTGHAAETRVVSERALALARGASDPVAAGRALRLLGESTAALGDTERARESLEESRRVLEPIGAALELGKTLCALGSLATTSGDPERAAVFLEEAEQLYSGISNDVGMARVARLRSTVRGPGRSASNARAD